MCGIAGLVTLDGQLPDRLVLQAMIGALSHRGPDGLSMFIRANVGLAHARLAIIDLDGGRQPMTNEDGTLWITFNGEIFNYIELREKLLRRGHVFRTASDTEVILHLYEEEGESCVDRLNGQWAFAIWDSRKRRLFMSRDRMGVRPLFYTVADRTFLFASEIKALLGHPAVSLDIDPIALDQTFTFWAPVQPRTIFRQVCALPPAHSMVFEDGRLSVRRYWRIEFDPTDAEHIPERQQADQLLELLTDATRVRLRSDVPVGAYLSGGLDSSVVTALAQQVGDRRIRTFSIAFDDPQFDETAEQDAVVRFLGTEHTRFHCSAADIGRVFPDVVRHIETPILRTAPAPMFLLSRTVRDAGFKVVLTGEGSDELLGGYDIFKETKIRTFCAANPKSQRRQAILRRLYPYLPALQRQSDAYRAAFFKAGSPNDDLFFSHRPRWEATARLKLFFSDAVRSELTTADPEAELAATLPPQYEGWERFVQAQCVETTHLLPGYILSSQGDRAAMAHGVEGRFPFLDHRLVEFATSLPVHLKMKVLNEKYLLKMSAEGLVPDSVRVRPKQPYRAPDAQSFFLAKSPDYVGDLLSPAQIARHGLFRPSAVARLVEKCREGRVLGNTDSMALIGILSSQLIVHTFVNDCRSRHDGHTVTGAATLHR